MLLALAKRFESYETLGQAFKALKDDILEDTLAIKLWKFFTELFVEILSELAVDWELFMGGIIKKNNILEKIKSSFNFLFYSDREMVPFTN